jgi:hypothetical protein
MDVIAIAIDVQHANGSPERQLPDTGAGSFLSLLKEQLSHTGVEA